MQRIKYFNLICRSSIFQFLWPFSTELWLVTLASFMVFSLTFYSMDILSHKLYENREKLRKSNPTANSISNSNHISATPTAKLHSYSGLANSFWYMYSSMVGAGTEENPKTLSLRLLAGIWWLFVLIMTSFYTANLAAYLTVQRIELPIKSLKDLVNSNTMTYGTVKYSYLESLLSSSQIELYKRAWAEMSELFPNALVSSHEEGVRKVKEENYALIWDEIVNQYTTRNDCSLMVANEPFSSREYGIAIMKGIGKLRSDITTKFLELDEEGYTEKMFKRYVVLSLQNSCALMC